MRTMVTMAQHAYRIIKAINPAAQIITPAASAAGARLFELNSEHWTLNRPERSIEGLLTAAVRV